MSNKYSFSKLNADEKTFNHVKEYYIAMEKGIQMFSIDMKIQKDELENHLKCCGKNECDQGEIEAWVLKNSEPLRAYLNTLKLFTLFMYIDNEKDYRREIVWPLFIRFVGIWNAEKELILDTIRVEK